MIVYEVYRCESTFVGSAGQKMKGYVESDQTPGVGFKGKKVGTSLGQFDRGCPVDHAWKVRYFFDDDRYRGSPPLNAVEAEIAVVSFRPMLHYREIVCSLAFRTAKYVLPPVTIFNTCLVTGHAVQKDARVTWYGG
jgi:hypothetical protein